MVCCLSVFIGAKSLNLFIIYLLLFISLLFFIVLLFTVGLSAGNAGFLNLLYDVAPLLGPKNVINLAILKLSITCFSIVFHAL